ncbi:cytochrome P450 705A1-like [Coffea eugenioides]|uniref:cytochrome P450 705A1-like n=1 Tax=Coffea eugenioides TaxID=49369 RepID=UPI000F60FB66|nr:cytochrome P450 705A1-like [Coffea eugenioides]
MKEILRLHPLASLITRKCREHCKIDVFDIPKNTTILINTYAAMRDPNLWDDPNEFKPERFLIFKDTEKTLARQDQQEGILLDILTFGGGRRRCPGMMLAFHTMSPTVAAMVQCFDWTPIEEGREVDAVNMEVRKGFIHVMEQSLVCTPRVRLNPLDCIA